MAKRKTKEDKIVEIISEVDDWDLDTLIDWAKDKMREDLEQLSPKGFNDEYKLFKRNQ